MNASQPELRSIDGCRMRKLALRKRLHNLFERLAPMLIILELVEAGAGWGQEDNIAGLGRLCGALHGCIQSFGVDDFYGVSEFGIQSFRRRANGVNNLHSFPQQVVQNGIVAAFIFAAENQVNIGGE